MITKKPTAWARPQIERMLAVMRHEAFYETGTWESPAIGVYAGWSVRQPAGFVPVARSADGAAVMIFSGEDFSVGHWNGNGAPTPSSSLFEAYERDPRFPAGLNGRFHGLAIDERRATALLFNDRWGLHRLYYYEAPEATYFAAEAKAILAVRPELRRLDSRSLGEFVSCGCVLENRTLFQDVRVLPPASTWTIRAGALETRQQYFHPGEWEEQTPLEPEQFYLQLRETFAAALPRYFNGAAPVGMSLTGGLDSRMILAWQKPTAGALPTYSFGGAVRDCQDVVMARRVADAIGLSHTVIPVDRDFLVRFPQYAARAVYLSDGCVDVNRAVDLYLNERAREIAPVRMTGNYGGEVLRGVRAFKHERPLPGLFDAELDASVEAAAQTYARVCEGHPVSFATFRQAPWFHYGLLALEETQVAVRTPYLDNEFVRTVFRAPTTGSRDEMCLRLIGEGSQVLRRIRTDRGLGGNGPRLLRRARRHVLEFTFKAEYAYDYGMPQQLARVDHALSAFHLERLFLGRHKFAHFRVWYRDALSRYVQDTLLDPAALRRAYLNRDRVERVVTAHLRGHGNYTTAIHKLLTLELLHRTFVDSATSAA
jgi:asparagine synthase (glutamine-hydrolysing)